MTAPLADVPDVDASVSLGAADGQQSPIGAPGDRTEANLRPPIEQHAAGFEIEDRHPRSPLIRVVDHEPPAGGIKYQTLRDEVQGQLPDHPSLACVPDGDTSFGCDKHQMTTVGVKSHVTRARKAPDQLAASQVPNLQ